MPTYKRARAGRIAKQVGELFESIIRARAYSSRITCIRIPDGCRHVRTSRGYQLQRVRTPFDYILIRDHGAILLDAKTTESDRFTHSQIIPHQLEALLDYSRDARLTGYLVWHRDSDRVIMYSSRELASLKKGQSLSYRDGHGIDLGTAHQMDLAKLYETIVPIPLTHSACVPTE